MLKKITLTLGLASFIALTGCATNHHTTRNGKLLDVTRVEKFITKDQSTLSDVRELIGTPAYAAKTVQGNDIVGYSFVGERSGASAAGHAIADILTLGIAADDEHKTVQKNIYFLLDDNKVVKDIKYGGYMGIYHFGSLGASQYMKALRKMTDEELRQTENYSDDYIINSWKQYIVEKKPEDVAKVAADKKKTIEELDEDDVIYPYNSIPGILYLSAKDCFGDVTNYENNAFGGKLPNDGVKSALLLGE